MYIYTHTPTIVVNPVELKNTYSSLIYVSVECSFKPSDPFGAVPLL